MEKGNQKREGKRNTERSQGKGGNTRKSYGMRLSNLVVMC